jgi:hypothetical protein
MYDGAGGLCFTSARLVLNFARDMAKNVTEAEKAQGLSELAVFQTWFAKHVLGPDDDTGSNAILIMPSGRTKPKYRDEPNE